MPPTHTSRRGGSGSGRRGHPACTSRARQGRWRSRWEGLAWAVSPASRV